MGQDLGVPGQRHHDEEWRLGQAQQLMRHWAWRDSIGEADEDTLVALVRQGLRILGDMLGQVLQGLVPDDPVWKSAEAFPGVGTTAEVEGLLQGLWRGGFIDRQDPPSIYRINDKGRVLAMIVSIAVTGIDLEDPQLLIRW